MGNFFFFKDYRELWTKCCRRGMQVVKWVQYPLGTLLSAPEASKNATKEGWFSILGSNFQKTSSSLCSSSLSSYHKKNSSNCSCAPTTPTLRFASAQLLLPRFPMLSMLLMKTLMITTTINALMSRTSGWCSTLLERRGRAPTPTTATWGTGGETRLILSISDEQETLSIYHMFWFSCIIKSPLSPMRILHSKLNVCGCLLCVTFPINSYVIVSKKSTFLFQINARLRMWPEGGLCRHVS